LTSPDLGSGHRRQGGAGMLDVLMVTLTVVFFAVAFAMIAWLERV
jgi:hypothetical protein